MPSFLFFITAYEEFQYNRDSHFLICGVFFVSKGNLFDVYFTTLQLVLVPCGAVERLPVLYHSADYISFPLGFHCGIFENGVLLVYMLKGVTNVADFMSAYGESQ